MHLTEKIYSFILWIVLALTVFLTRSNQMFSIKQSSADISDMTTYWQHNGPENGSNHNGPVFYTLNDSKSEGR